MYFLLFVSEIKKLINKMRTFVNKYLLFASVSIILNESFAQKVNSSKRPNIVVIKADDLGWNDVGFHGSREIPTPNIDALAYNGLILNRHYVLPTCTPSRTAFMTGRYPMKTGMQGYPLEVGEARGIPLQMKLLPQYLKRLGYVTRLLGKWHVGYYTKCHTPTYRGFDSFFGYYNGFIQYYNHTILEDNYTGRDFNRNVYSSLSPVDEKGYFTDLITEEAEEIIKTHDTSRPLYLQVNHLAPHCSDAKEPMEVRNETEMNDRLAYIKDINRRRFASIVTSLDESVGKIVTSLKDTGMLQNSIILFTSDNGAQTIGFLENFGSNFPLRGLKFTLFEGGIRAAACLYSPLIKNNGRVVNQLVHITDWLPTFYAAAGGNVDDLSEDGLDGINQWPVLKDNLKNARNFTLLNIDDYLKLEGAILDRFKLLKGAAEEYGDYYGEDTRNQNNSPYNDKNVFNSPVNKAIRESIGWTVSERRMKILRSKSTVYCKRLKNYPKCNDRCLFDIDKDPCETKDISSKFPQIVSTLEEYINHQRLQLVSQSHNGVDSAAIPSYPGGHWMPWIACTNCSTLCVKQAKQNSTCNKTSLFDHLLCK